MNPTKFAARLTDEELHEELCEHEQSRRFNAFYYALCFERQNRTARRAAQGSTNGSPDRRPD
jgi:hypothetical protein